MFPRFTGADISDDPASVHDAFDPLYWDPDLPASGPRCNNSPDELEPPTPAPPRMAYTTVGSLVDPNNVPQFTAPNRIQREGANRRPLAITQHRGNDTFFQQKPSQPLAMQNSMQYAQAMSQNTENSRSTNLNSYYRTQQSALGSQHANYNSVPTIQVMNDLRYMYQENTKVSPGPQKILSHSNNQGQENRFGQGISEPNRQIDLHESLNRGADVNRDHSDQEAQNLLAYIKNGTLAMARSTGVELTQTSSSKMINNNQDHTHGTLPTLAEPESGHSMPTNKTWETKDNMQTLQRLSRFENPFQKLAMDRVSGASSLNNSELFETNKMRAQQILKNSYQPLGSGDYLGYTTSYLNPKAPAASIWATQTVESAYGSMSDTESFVGTSANYGPGMLNQNFRFPPTRLIEQPGYTANPLLMATEEARTGPGYYATVPTNYAQPLAAGPPGLRLQYQVKFSSSDNQPLASTIPYWKNNQSLGQPYGTNFSVWNNRPDGLWTKNYPGNPSPPVKSIDAQTLAIVSKYYPNGFPADLKLGKSVKTDLVALSEAANSAKRNAAALIAKNIEEYEKFIDDSQEDCHQAILKTMEKINLKDALGQILKTAADTIESYKGHSSWAILSKFGTSPAWQMDLGENGNMSYFGEDWGPPPKRLGRDPRYQPDFHNPRFTHWEEK